MDAISVKSQAKYDLVGITRQVQSLVSKSGAKSGTVLVFVPHTTAGIICNEAETNLKSDILKVLGALDEHAEFFGGFAHDQQEGNAHAHIIAALSGTSRSFIIENGTLQLGTWQSIMLLEMDGPRKRTIFIKILTDNL